MPDLTFRIISVEPERHAAVPTLAFGLRVTDETEPGIRIASVVLRCQIRIEPGRRPYSDRERERLRDLFGTPERWGQTVKPMLWTHVLTTIPAFESSIETSLLVPCVFDFGLAATRYFEAIEAGSLPLCFLFSGTIFHETDEGHLRTEPISWEKESAFPLPAETWQALRELYYPNIAWLPLRREILERLDRYRSDRGLTGWNEALDRLLAGVEERVTP